MSLRRIAFGIAATAASTGLVLSAAPSAWADSIPTTTNFMNACVASASGLNQHQLAYSAVTVQHTSVNPVGSNNVYVLETAPQVSMAVGTNISGFTFDGVEQVKVSLKIDPLTFVSASLVSGTGFGYTGIPQVTVSGDRLTVSGTGAAGLSVGPGVTFQAPKVQIVTTNPEFDVKLYTSGMSGLYGNYASDYFTFISKVKLPMGIRINAPTACIPADPPEGRSFVDSDIGIFPVLNSGAGALH